MPSVDFLGQVTLITYSRPDIFLTINDRVELSPRSTITKNHDDDDQSDDDYDDNDHGDDVDEEGVGNSNTVSLVVQCKLLVMKT